MDLSNPKPLTACCCFDPSAVLFSIKIRKSEKRRKDKELFFYDPDFVNLYLPNIYYTCSLKLIIYKQR